MTVVTWRLRGRAELIQAFAQVVVEATQELERTVFVSFPCSLLFLFCCFFFVGRASAPTGCSPQDSGQLHSS